MKTQLAEISVTFNGRTGRFDVTFRHMPNNAEGWEEETVSALFLQGVEEAIRAFRIKWKL